MTIDEIRQECWTKAQQSLATHYIFRRKVERYELLIRINTLLGILTPIGLGAVVATYGLANQYADLAVLIAGPLSILQAVLSGIAVVNKWDWLLSYSVESMTANRIHYQRFLELARYPPTDVDVAERKFIELSISSDEREMQDEKIHFSHQEDRNGTRYSLWIMQRECPVCHEVPKSIRPTKCETCGKP